MPHTTKQVVRGPVLAAPGNRLLVKQARRRVACKRCGYEQEILGDDPAADVEGERGQVSDLAAALVEQLRTGA